MRTIHTKIHLMFELDSFYNVKEIVTFREVDSDIRDKSISKVLIIIEKSSTFFVFVLFFGV